VPVATEELVVACTPVLTPVLDALVFAVELISGPTDPELLLVTMTPVLTGVLDSVVLCTVKVSIGPADPELLLVTMIPVRTGVLDVLCAAASRSSSLQETEYQQASN
jgi:hypothetical protein